MHSFTIIGMGRVGGAMALSLSRAGCAVECLVTKHRAETDFFAADIEPLPRVVSVDEFSSIDTTAVLITTQDGEIENAANLISGLESKSSDLSVFHMSGALSSESLSVLEKRGFNTGSIHPLVSISDPERGSNALAGAFFAVEGNPAAVELGKEIVAKLGGIPFELETQSKMLYHAAAVMACGHLIALVHSSRKMLESCGLDEETAAKVLMPLIRSTVENLSDLSPAKALTGPFQRGDRATIEKHLARFGQLGDSDLESVYRCLGMVSLELAASGGTAPDKIEEIRNLILLDKNISR